jgi:protein dithiol oxidoreductase (disulfide-forming)
MLFRALLVAAALAVFSSGTLASVVEGKDYTVLKEPQPVENKGKIEVLEVFSYACPHCFEMHPRISAWAGKQPSDVVLRKVPAGFRNPGWIPLARAYYALESTGDLKRLEGPLFEAIHRERQPLVDENAITEWVAKQGVDRAKFSAAWNSFGVNTRMSQNERQMVGYQVTGVPMIVVDGRYTVLGNSYDQLLANAAGLVAKVRAERAAKPK